MNILNKGQHLDSLLRQTRLHHVHLSSMADVKANIMLTLASLLITFAVRYLADPVLRWPIALMILFCLGTIVLSAYAVMPKSNRQAKPDLNNPNCNMLFFGNFVALDFNEYRGYMERLMSDEDAVYEEQVREVYEMGIYLNNKKYRFIRYGYLTFIVGLVVSGLALVFVSLFLG